MGRIVLTSEPFNSRPHKEVDEDQLDLLWDQILSIHDLTRRSTMVELDIVKNVRPFNSRPHKEVDMIVRGDSTCSLLSIHDLTRRSTALTMREKAFIYLSIHDLTRRSTKELLFQ